MAHMPLGSANTRDETQVRSIDLRGHSYGMERWHGARSWCYAHAGRPGMDMVTGRHGSFMSVDISMTGHGEVGRMCGSKAVDLLGVGWGIAPGNRLT